MKHAAFIANPVGRGFRRHLKSEWVDGKPLPNTEELNRPITRPDNDYYPMALGPLGRGWAARAQYAGTYDDKWLEDHFPFLPPDFDERYYQAAPLDQQLPFSHGGQEVVLANLTADSRRNFLLPNFEAPVQVFPKRGERNNHKGTLDTIVFRPDDECFTMSWRVTLPLNRSIFEIAQVLVGRKSNESWQKSEETIFPIPVVA